MVRGDVSSPVYLRAHAICCIIETILRGECAEKMEKGETT